MLCSIFRTKRVFWCSLVTWNFQTWTDWFGQFTVISVLWLVCITDGIAHLYTVFVILYSKNILQCSVVMCSISQSVTDFRVVQVIKSLQDPLKVGNDLMGIDDNVRKRGLEEKCFRLRRKVERDGAEVTLSGRLFQMVGPATGKARPPTVDSKFCGRHQEKVGPSRTEATPTWEICDTNQLTQI